VSTAVADIDQVRLRTAFAAVALWSCAMLMVAIFGGVQHDYVSYLGQWNLVLRGANPWSTDNAYGPVHNMLALLLPLGRLAPKLVIAGALVAANAMLVRELVNDRGLGGLGYGYILAIPANFLVVTMGFVYGLNDALAAAFVSMAAIARYRERLLLAGFILAIAILLKYYPVFLVPLFALRNGRISVRLIAAAAITTIVGLGLAFAVWGDALLAPFYLGIERGPKILSVLSALQTHPLLIGPGILDFLIRTNAVFVTAIGGLAIFTAWKMQLNWLEASVLTLLAILLAYKVGHQQFYIPWLFLVAALPLAGTASSLRLRTLCLPFATFLSAFQLGYFLSNGTPGFTIVRHYVGFAAFPLGVATIAAYFLSWPRMRQTRPAGVEGLHQVN
jgi:hypothetical protein